MKYYLGCTQWHHDRWKGVMYSSAESKQALLHYGRIFPTVEGNTTFYALPTPDRFSKWLKSVPQSFKFCFKLPKSVTHGSNSGDLVWNQDADQFFGLLLDHISQVGPIMVQVSPRTSGQHLDNLGRLFDRFPKSFTYAIEVRHQDFYEKGQAEKDLNSLLKEFNFDRTMFDTRGLFNDENQTHSIEDARTKKPRFPLHVTATGNQPFIRYLGYSDMGLNEGYWQQWFNKLGQWIAAGKTPYFMMHTAGNGRAPLFAQEFAKQFNRYLVDHNLAVESELPVIEIADKLEQDSLF